MRSVMILSAFSLAVCFLFAVSTSLEYWFCLQHSLRCVSGYICASVSDSELMSVFWSPVTVGGPSAFDLVFLCYLAVALSPNRLRSLLLLVVYYFVSLFPLVLVRLWALLLLVLPLVASVCSACVAPISSYPLRLSLRFYFGVTTVLFSVQRLSGGVALP